MPETAVETFHSQSPAQPTQPHRSLLILRPVIALAILIVAQLAMTSFSLRRTITDPERAASFLHGDTGTYIGIAEPFTRGDFSMAWVRSRPHRVPLLSAVLAIPLAFSGESLVGFAVVDVIIACLLVASVYLAILILFENRAVAFLLGIACLANPFLLEFNTRRLMTEPLFVVLAIWAGCFFVLYARNHRPRDLLLTALSCSLAYLTRVNGLFLILTMMGCLAAFDSFLALRSPRAKRFRFSKSIFLRYTLATLVVLMVTAPNWWPRWHYFHNPIAHGYPTNYLWVDSFRQGTTGMPIPSFGWKDYASTHDFHDFVVRWRNGIHYVCYAIPIRIEKIAIPYWLAVAGVVISLLRRKTEYILLSFAMIVVLLPAMWTFLPVQVWRIPYSSFLPFEFILAAVALDFGCERLAEAMAKKRTEARRMNPGMPRPPELCETSPSLGG